MYLAPAFEGTDGRIQSGRPMTELQAIALAVNDFVMP